MDDAGVAPHTSLKPTTYYLPILIVGVGVIVLFGWLLGLNAIKSVIPGLTAMNPMTAVSFILVGAALWLLTTKQHTPWAQTLGLVVAGISLLKLIDLVLGTNIGIDRLLFPDKLNASAVPNRMAPNTVICFLLLGSALYLNGRANPRLVRFTQGLTLVTILIAFLALIGYVYDVTPFYGMLTYIPMALNTAIVFLIACLCLFSVQPSTGIMAVWRGTTTGAVVARRLLPAAILVPSVVGGLLLWGQRSGLYGAEFGAALVATLNVLLLIAGVGWTAGFMHRSDIARRKMEQALRESEARYRGLFENSSDTILIADEQGCYLDANPQAEQLTGYNRDEILSLCVNDLTFRVMPNTDHDLYQEISRQGGVTGEYMITRKDGTEVPVEFAAVSIAPGVYQSILHDVAAHKKLEDNLRSALDRQRELNGLKSRFMSMISHDFRTPLAVIVSSTDLLLSYGERMDYEKRTERLQKVQHQVNNLIEMLDDILVLGKADTLGVEFKPESLDLREFCTKLVSDIQPALTKHQIKFSSSGNCKGVKFDPKLLRQAVTNLLTNAAKYSPERDEVLFSLQCSEEEAIISVQDRGIGIPEDDQQKLFEVFHRARNVGGISGTGLGLTIVKQAVDAHGGTISVESHENVGTTFTICLPRVEREKVVFTDA
jgi:PAS domain S-box-containing protein